MKFIVIVINIVAVLLCSRGDEAVDLCNGQSGYQPPFLHPAESCTSATLPQKYPRYSDSSELFIVGVVSSSKVPFHSFPLKADNCSIYVVILNLECIHT